jgi:hypothetical protein
LLGGASQRPAAELHTPAPWQAGSVRAAEQSRGVPVQAPAAVHVPFTVQKSGEVQAAPAFIATNVHWSAVSSQAAFA